MLTMFAFEHLKTRTLIFMSFGGISKTQSVIPKLLDSINSPRDVHCPFLKKQGKLKGKVLLLVLGFDVVFYRLDNASVPDHL